MASLVSILIPAYNSERWIADTLNSALSQTWPRKEIIVVDDGSMDRTLSIARRFESPSVKVMSQPHCGASSARNTALAIAQGDYIQWLDADDLLAPDKIAKQMEVAAHASKRTLLSSAWGAFLYRPAKARFLPTSLWADLSPVEWFVRKLAQNLHMQTATWLVSRGLTEAAGPWDTRLSLDDDGEYFSRVLVASEAIQFVLQAKVFYRNPGFHRLSNIDCSDKKLESQFRSITLQIGYIRSLEESGRVRAACLKYLQRWLFWFYDARQDLAEELERLSVALGGHLELPQVRKKYRWIQQIAGRRVARRAQELLPRAKWAVIRLWDFALWGFEELLFGKQAGRARTGLAS
jgi:glycosyltransferase involved in cell wall biosynthesis